MNEQYGVVARAAGQIVSGKDYSIHLGGDFEDLIQPAHSIVNGINGAQTLTLNDRPELRIDPTSLISTGAIANVSSAQVYSVEAAGTYGPLFVQGEYFWFNIQRDANTGLPPIGAPDLKFQGGYGQVGYVLTGESHPYNAAAAAYGGIKPARPFDLNGGGWGAWEIAARYSTMDLNNLIGTTTGVAGGRQNVITVGLNWYANNNVRLMFDYLHGDISKQVSPTNFGDAGSKFDAFAMRTQVAF
jgi:phosphate-selective porin OprO/OprP